MLPLNKREKKRAGRMRVKKEEKVVSASVVAQCCSALTLQRVSLCKETHDLICMEVENSLYS